MTFSKATSSILRSEIRRGSQWITIYGPETGNGLCGSTLNELRRTFKTIDMKTVRAVVLTGHGSTFSSGVSPDYLSRLSKLPHDEVLTESYGFFDLLQLVNTCPLPVIARVNGDAYGGSLGLLAACDMTFGVRSARFAALEHRTGMNPALSLPFLRPRISHGHLNRFILSGEKYTAPKAKEIGLLHEVVDTESDLDIIVENTLTAILQNSPSAVRECKASLLRCHSSSGSPTEVRNIVCKAAANSPLSERISDRENLIAILENREPLHLSRACS